MKLSDDTIKILTSFSAINKSIWIEPGNVIKTKPELGTSPTCVAIVEEEFEVAFGIYEVKKFLQLYTLFNDPDVEITDTYIELSDSSGKSAMFRHTDEDNVSHPKYDKNIRLPSIDIEADITEANVKDIKKSAKTLGKPNIAFQGRNGKLVATTYNTNLPTKAQKKEDEFTIILGETDKKFNMIFDVEDLALINNDYNIQLCFAGLAQFKSNNVTYYVSPDGNSTYEK